MPEEREEREERDRRPQDDDAVWEQLVASFAADPPSGGARPWPEAEQVDDDRDDGERAGDGDRNADDADDRNADDADDRDDDEGEDTAGGPGDGSLNTTRSILVATGPVHHPRELGPRDHEEVEDEDHFVPPPPPPLPKVDTTTKFAWIAVLGGPLLLLAMVLAQQPITWWMAVLGVGGFLGGFGTLVFRMPDRTEEDEEDPDGGAVV
ncbi:hypothetical protein GCM10027168_29870 [Streptomyces capparidis]